MSQDVKLVGVAREEYERGALSEREVAGEPVAQFRTWFEEARGANVRGLDEMVVATVGADGRPSARVVLLKGIEPAGAGGEAGGIVFVTNYESRKGREAKATGRAAVVVWWKELERQVRWEGEIERAPAAVSDAVFKGRPREAQIGAWASRQSREIASREELEAAVTEYTRKFEGSEVPRPEFWGAFVIRPERVEFWQGRASRLHDRVEYVKTGSGWRVRRLSP